MIRTAKTCALKRTAKTAGVWTLAIGISIAIFLCIATGAAFVINVLTTMFPILNMAGAFIVLVVIGTVFVGMPVIAVYDEYRRNVRDCENEELMRAEKKL